jgi:nucleoside-diphosphate-sugar epimerase
MSKAVLVTGCAGFIGSNFTRQFREQFPETEVVGLDNFATGRREALDEKITFYEGSILDRVLLEKIFAEHPIEYVFHFAALPRVSFSVEQPTKTTEANILGTITLMESAKNHGVKRFIFSSSSAVYGGAKTMPTSEAENPPNPKTPYAMQKYAIEPFCKIFTEIYGMDTVCLRYFNVFGPGQYGDSPYSTVISAWLESLYFPRNKKAFLEDDGEQSRDFCYVDNVIQANILAMKHEGKLNGEVFNVAHGERTTVNEVKKLIEEFTGRKLDLEKRQARLGDVRHTNADISKARNILGYNPEVKFNEGLKRAVAWYEKRIVNERVD